MNKCGCQGRCSCGRGYSGYPHVWEKNDPWDKTLDNIPKNKQIEYDTYGQYTNTDPDDLFFKGTKRTKPVPIPLKAVDDSWKLDYERELKDPIKIVFPRSAAEEAAEKAARETASVGPVSILTLKGVIAVDVKVESLNDLVIDSKIFKIKRAIQEKLCEIKEIDITTKISVDLVDLKQTIT